MGIAKRIDDLEIAVAALAQARLDSKTLFRRAQEANLKAQQRALTEDAARRGTFGILTFFVNDEIYSSILAKTRYLTSSSRCHLQHDHQSFDDRENGRRGTDNGFLLRPQLASQTVAFCCDQCRPTTTPESLQREIPLTATICSALFRRNTRPLSFITPTASTRQFFCGCVETKWRRAFRGRSNCLSRRILLTQ